MTVPKFLPIMFGNRQLWQQRDKHLYLGEHEGKKVGTVVATMSPKFDQYALNKRENVQLLAALHSGKVAESAAQVSGQA